nr:glycosyltransferase 87 family protein [Labedella populi]
MRARVGLWIAFLVIHAGLAWLCLAAPGLPLGDVTLVYRPWSIQLASGSPVVGIDLDWVYPLLAHVPMQLALVAGESVYAEAWLVLMTVLDAVAFAILVGDGSSRRRGGAAWWWLAFIALLGPISLGRIDSVTVPLAVVAVLIVMRRPTAASILLAVATWMKVWPAAILVAAVLALRSRWRVVVASAVFSFGVVFLAFALGGSAHVFSFLGEQSGRGLQLEAPVSLFYVWQTAMGVESASIYYDQAILTYQVAGSGIDVVIALMTPLLVVVVLAVALLGAAAVRAGASTIRVLPSLSLALVLVLIAVNKVGSPQYLTWLIAPVVLGLAWQGRRFLVPAALALGLGALTHVVYPYLYWMLLWAWPPMVVVLTVRNVGYLVLLGWCVVELVRARRAAPTRRPPAVVRDELAAHHP